MTRCGRVVNWINLSSMSATDTRHCSMLSFFRPTSIGRCFYEKRAHPRESLTYGLVRKQNGMLFSPYRSIGKACVAQASYFRTEKGLVSGVRPKYGFTRIGTETKRKQNGMSFQVTGPLERPASRRLRIFETKIGSKIEVRHKYGFARIRTETKRKQNGMSLRLTSSNLEPNPECLLHSGQVF
jgi:hypothetical protein